MWQQFQRYGYAGKDINRMAAEKPGLDQPLPFSMALGTRFAWLVSLRLAAKLTKSGGATSVASGDGPTM